MIAEDASRAVPGWSLCAIDPAQLAPCYDLLRDTFTPGELVAAAVFHHSLTVYRTLDGPLVYRMLAHRAADGLVVSLIAGCYLPLTSAAYPAQGVGFIEYLTTRRGFRQHGHATALLRAFEGTMAKTAAARGEHLRLILGEVDGWMIPFKRRRGYFDLPGSLYRQPPIAFDPQTGAPLGEAIPKCLMCKPIGQENNQPSDNNNYRKSPTFDPVPKGQISETDLILEALWAILDRRYVPSEATPGARAAIRDHLARAIFVPFAESIG